jgi:hypothetical protein
MTTEGTVLEGRNCDGCAMCCKLLIIDDFNKPSNEWCRHCNPKKGCTIYDQRPQTCRNFNCGYLVIPGLSDDWKPAKCKFMITFDAPSNRIQILMDPTRPDGWRAEPYYSRIKQWSKDAVAARGQVLVHANNRTIIVLPDRDKDLGHVRQDQIIRTLETRGPNGIALDVIVVDRADARPSETA